MSWGFLFLVITFLASSVSTIICTVRKNYKFMIFSLSNILIEISYIVVLFYGTLKETGTDLEKWKRAFLDGKLWPFYAGVDLLFMVVWWIVVCKKLYARKRR
ncbi:hypothetical protein [Paenibacillus larvae]|nr:hypothetical protein [Paenibacillus larvae]AVG11134.1 hypothetical protein ERICII_00699 [Paenibacillus larvae subsp. larvae DSM 25430]MDR5594894.1 hypothetical protein [Paenibacillus larvae]